MKPGLESLLAGVGTSVLFLGAGYILAELEPSWDPAYLGVAATMGPLMTYMWYRAKRNPDRQ